jgi:hypothetical protein
MPIIKWFQAQRVRRLRAIVPEFLDLVFQLRQPAGQGVGIEIELEIEAGQLMRRQRLVQLFKEGLVLRRRQPVVIDQPGLDFRPDHRRIKGFKAIVPETAGDEPCLGAQAFQKGRRVDIVAIIYFLPHAHPPREATLDAIIAVFQVADGRIS